MAARLRLRVVRGALVRVLAVGELGHLDEARDEPVREGLDVGEPGRDRRLVRRRCRERLGRELAARVERDGAVARGAASSTSPKRSRRQSGITCAKFFAAPRSIDGPPMSIISTASSSRTP